MMVALSASEWINALLLLATVLGVLAATRQLRMTAKTQRAVFLKDLYWRMRSDPDVQAAYYMIEYDQFSYDDTFHGSEYEPKVDRLLTLFDLVCELYWQSALTKKDMMFFAYQMQRVYCNQDIQNYLSFLGKFYQANEVVKIPFAAYQKYAREVLMLAK